MSYTWAVISGSLPPGLSLSATGAITGTPSLAAQGSTAPVVAAAPGWRTPATLTAGSLLTGTALVTGASAGPGVAVPGSRLAGGAASGTYTFTVQVTDHLGATATAVLSITVTAGSAALTVTPAVLPAATLGTPYHAALGATQGVPPYQWSEPSAYGATYTSTYGVSSLPPGVALNRDGTITGTPTAQGTFTFTAQATDTAGGSAQAVFTLTVGVRLVIPPAAGPWRILYGPPQPAGGVTGEVLQAQNKTITLRTEPDQNHEVSFDADGLSPAIAGIVELETDLIVMYGSQIVFDGRVVPTQDTLTASAHRTQVTALDYREVLRRRAVLPGDQLTWANVEQSTIAWNMIQATQARAGGNLGIARGLGQATGVTRTQTNTLGDYIGDAITNLAKLNNGFEWQVTPYGFADLRLDVFYPQQGTSRGVVLAWGSGRISSITRTVDPSTFADAVYVTSSASVSGTKTLTPQYLQAADIATRAEQRWDSVIGTDDQTQSTLNDHATALLNQAQVVVPSYSIVFYPGAWGGPADIWLGDQVLVQIDSGRLQVNDLLRVVEMSFAISPDNVETLTLTVGAIPFRLNRKIASILKSIRYLKTR